MLLLSDTSENTQESAVGNGSLLSALVHEQIFPSVV